MSDVERYELPMRDENGEIENEWCVLASDHERIVAAQAKEIAELRQSPALTECPACGNKEVKHSAAELVKTIAAQAKEIAELKKQRNSYIKTPGTIREFGEPQVDELIKTKDAEVALKINPERVDEILKEVCASDPWEFIQTMEFNGERLIRYKDYNKLLRSKFDLMKTIARLEAEAKLLRAVNAKLKEQRNELVVAFTRGPHAYAESVKRLDAELAALMGDE